MDETIKSLESLLASKVVQLKKKKKTILLVKLTNSNVYNSLHPCAIHTVVQKIPEQIMSSREFLPGSTRYNSLNPTLDELSDLVTRVSDRGERSKLPSQAAHNPPKAAEEA